jgi:hypothetical protein
MQQSPRESACPRIPSRDNTALPAASADRHAAETGGQCRLPPLPAGCPQPPGNSGSRRAPQVNSSANPGQTLSDRDTAKRDTAKRDTAKSVSTTDRPHHMMLGNSPGDGFTPLPRSSSSIHPFRIRRTDTASGLRGNLRSGKPQIGETSDRGNRRSGKPQDVSCSVRSGGCRRDQLPLPAVATEATGQALTAVCPRPPELNTA